MLGRETHGTGEIGQRREVEVSYEEKRHVGTVGGDSGELREC